MKKDKKDLRIPWWTILTPDIRREMKQIRANILAHRAAMEALAPKKKTDPR